MSRGIRQLQIDRGHYESIAAQRCNMPQLEAAPSQHLLDASKPALNLQSPDRHSLPLTYVLTIRWTISGPRSAAVTVIQIADNQGLPAHGRAPHSCTLIRVSIPGGCHSGSVHRRVLSLHNHSLSAFRRTSPAIATAGTSVVFLTRDERRHIEPFTLRRQLPLALSVFPRIQDIAQTAFRELVFTMCCQLRFVNVHVTGR